MGRLILVPTPIGNLEDITLRALRILKEADLILAEDTRKAFVLLKHFNISNTVASHHSFNEHKTVAGIVRNIAEGKVVALITDAGTPGISDPGFLIVRECIKADVEVECLPGATAFVPALVLSGLPSDSFVFVGFLPVKKGRATAIAKLIEETRTMIFYESPHRIKKTLEQLNTALGEHRLASVSREISKIHEETVRGTLGELNEKFNAITQPRGEMVIVISGLSSKCSS